MREPTEEEMTRPSRWALAYLQAECTKPPEPAPMPEPDDDYAGFFRALFLACFIGLTLFGVLGGALYFIFHDYIRGAL